MEERNSSATVQEGPEEPEIVTGQWLLDETPGVGQGVVWRVKTLATTYTTNTRLLTLEHIISTLKDDVLFGETTWEDIEGEGEPACSAYAATQFILSHQSLWELGDFEFDEWWPYKFNGETLFAALETVTSTLPDAYWEYDLTRIPFRIHIRRLPRDPGSEMRPGRNIETLRMTIM